MFYFSLLIHGTPYKKHGPARLSAVTARLAGQRGSKTDLIDLMSSNSRRFRARSQATQDLYRWVKFQEVPQTLRCRRSLQFMLSGHGRFAPS